MTTKSGGKAAGGGRFGPGSDSHYGRFAGPGGRPESVTVRVRGGGGGGGAGGRIGAGNARLATTTVSVGSASRDPMTLRELVDTLTTAADRLGWDAPVTGRRGDPVAVIADRDDGVSVF